MKLVTTFVLTFIATASFAVAASPSSSFEGTYLHDNVDSIKVEATGESFRVAIVTNGSKESQCEFNGLGVQKGANEIIATQAADIQVPDVNDPLSTVYEPGSCQLRIVVKGKRATVVDASRDCQELCGTPEGLLISARKN